MSDAEWASALLGERLDVLSGFAFPSAGFTQHGGMPLIRIRDIDRETTEVNYRGSFDGRFVVRRGDTLIGMDGDFHVRRWRGTNSLLNQRVCRVSAKQGLADDSFLFWALQPIVEAIHRRTPQTTVRHLSAAEINSALVEMPPLPEQRAIAAVLDTIDEAIRQTEQIIAKLQQVKQGLLHDLLTRGIDDNGELRDPERHPEQFQDSALGRIPKGWEVASVGSLLADVDPAMRSGPFGSALLKHELVTTGVPLLGIDNVHVERFVSSCERFVTPQKARELSRYFVRPRDVMITIMGTVGRCCVVPEDVGEALSSKHVWTLTFDEGRYPAELACLQFNHAPWVLRHFARDEQGGIMAAIRSETLRSALLPVPSPVEARWIASVITDISRRTSEEVGTTSKLKLLKAGLAEDLLTGRVRTTSLAEVAA